MKEERNELPLGWVWARLGDMCVINPRHEGDVLTDGTPVSFVPMTAVDHQSGAISGTSVRPYGQVRKGFTHFAEGDVLFARITPCMENGKVAIARGLVNGIGCGTTEFHVLRPLGGILPEYVHRYVRQESFRRAAAANMSGTAGQLRVPTDYIKSVELPLAPLPEQRRIVAKIEALFEQSRMARQALDRIPPLLKKFRQAVLAAAFRGDLTRDWREQHQDVEPAAVLLERIRIAGLRRYQEEVRKTKADGRRPPRKPNNLEPKEIDPSELPGLPATWKWAQLPFLGELSRGKSKHRPRNDPRLFGGPYPFIQTGDIARSGGQVTSYTQAYNELGLAQSRLFPAGTVCITIAANIADSAVLTFPACFPDSVVGFTADRDCCNGQFLEYFIRTIRENLAQFAPATAQKNINLEILGEIAVPTPPIPEQREIVRQIGTLFALADSIEAAVQAARRRAAKLEQSILARAFRGELVPQNPNDEPASVGLERARARMAGLARNQRGKVRTPRQS